MPEIRRPRLAPEARRAPSGPARSRSAVARRGQRMRSASAQFGAENSTRYGCVVANRCAPTARPFLTWTPSGRRRSTIRRPKGSTAGTLLSAWVPSRSRGGSSPSPPAHSRPPASTLPIPSRRLVGPLGDPILGGHSRTGVGSRSRRLIATRWTPANPPEPPSHRVGSRPGGGSPAPASVQSPSGGSGASPKPRLLGVQPYGRGPRRTDERLVAQMRVQPYGWRPGLTEYGIRARQVPEVGPRARMTAQNRAGDPVPPTTTPHRA